ncbi:SDR family NAD(P)-dependent oxidoreductase [Tardiphaga sp.]|uniref:SDR family NAD(P)-dependent oxidoreductase n=1 Tax=Tardiphaga sp. TaxID=1926292 RepID=UPI0037DA50BA
MAIVTGGAQGLGAAFAAALAANAAKVVIADLHPAEPVAAAISAAGGSCVAMSMDVCDPASVSTVVSRTVALHGRIDILINNAGLFTNLPIQPFSDISNDAWDQVMAVNVRGTFECVKAVTPHMKAVGGGKIVNIASGTAIKGTPGLLHYVASKGAVIAMTRALARELGADGICVNNLSPGLTMNDNVRQNSAWTPDVIERNIKSRALSRDAGPDDLIGALLFLVSSASDFVTGQTLSVDGGSVMN